jgi:hypothetical protein
MPHGYRAEYEVKAEAVVEDDLFGGRFRCEFAPGRHTPKNEQEEYALERLVALGGATRVKPTKAKE